MTSEIYLTKVRVEPGLDIEICNDSVTIDLVEDNRTIWKRYSFDEFKRLIIRDALREETNPDRHC